MTNFEKYKDEILMISAVGQIALQKGKLRPCYGTRCEDCDFSGTDNCSLKALEWLKAEYKEPEVDWSKVPVDTPILVKEYEESEWAKRYFAKYEDENVYAFPGGSTSWSCNNSIYILQEWKYAKLADDEVSE